MDFKTFNTQGKRLLEDEVVRLTQLERDDIKLLYHLLEDKAIFKYNLTPTNNERELDGYFETTICNNARNKDYPFIVYDKRTGEYAGTTRFYEINDDYKSLVIGYTWYGTKFHGSGLNKHCKFLLLKCAFEELEMERVELRADSRNERSIFAMKSIGCQVEGILRKNIPLPDGTRRDTIVLSILRHEWFDHVKTYLLAKLS